MFTALPPHYLRIWSGWVWQITQDDKIQINELRRLLARALEVTLILVIIPVIDAVTRLSSSDFVTDEALGCARYCWKRNRFMKLDWFNVRWLRCTSSCCKIGGNPLVGVLPLQWLVSQKMSTSDKVTLRFAQKPITLDSSVIIFCKRFLKIEASVDKLLWTGCITWLTDALCWSHHGVTMV